jgi:hypothetical protein
VRNGIKSVFERDLEAELRSLNAAGAELIRLIKLPDMGLKAADCKSCSEAALCDDHRNELFRISALNTFEVRRESVPLEVWLQRWALVYKLP